MFRVEEWFDEDEPTLISVSIEHLPSEYNTVLPSEVRISYRLWDSNDGELSGWLFWNRDRSPNLPIICFKPNPSKKKGPAQYTILFTFYAEHGPTVEIPFFITPPFEGVRRETPDDE